MREPVEQGAGQPLGGKEAGPFVKRQIAGHQGRAAFVALAEHLKQQLGAGLRERHIAKFINDQQLVAGQLALQAAQSLLVPGLDQLVGQAAAVMNPTDSPFWHAARPSPSARWVLPVPLLPSAMMFSRRATYSQRASSSTRALLSDGRARKLKLSRLLVAGNRASLIRRSTLRRSRSISSNSAS